MIQIIPAKLFYFTTSRPAGSLQRAGSAKELLALGQRVPQAEGVLYIKTKPPYEVSFFACDDVIGSGRYLFPYYSYLPSNTLAFEHAHECV